MEFYMERKTINKFSYGLSIIYILYVDIEHAYTKMQIV